MGLMARDANKQLCSCLDRGGSLGLGVGRRGGGGWVDRSCGFQLGSTYLLNPRGVGSQTAVCLGYRGSGGLPWGSVG